MFQILPGEEELRVEHVDGLDVAEDGDHLLGQRAGTSEQEAAAAGL